MTCRMITAVCAAYRYGTFHAAALVLRPAHSASHAVPRSASQGITTRVARSTLLRLQPRGKTIERIRSDGDDDADTEAAAAAAAAADAADDDHVMTLLLSVAWHGRCYRR